MIETWIQEFRVKNNQIGDGHRVKYSYVAKMEIGRNK